ncbi:MAG: biopolymer transporter ExbD [Bacteroidota bacterium]
MARGKNRGGQEVNAGSMADIAFLLLIFFLVTTTIASDKGILLILPPKPDPNQPPPDINKNAKNIFKILANSKDKLLVEDEPFGGLEDVPKLRKAVKEFVLNFGNPDEETLPVYNSLPSSLKAQSKKSPDSSDNPKEAVVSFKADRGTSYELFIAVIDELQAAYNEIYGERVGNELLQYFPDSDQDDLADIFRNLDKSDPKLDELYDEARAGIPRNISIAEPD